MEEEGKYLSSVPHEPRLDHPVEGGLEDPEELLFGSRNLMVCSQWLNMLKILVLEIGKPLEYPEQDQGQARQEARWLRLCNNSITSDSSN